jgi:flagellar M-ring protein FliF
MLLARAAPQRGTAEPLRPKPFVCMDNAVIATTPTETMALAANEAGAAPAFSTRWRSLPGRTQMGALLGLAALVAVVLALFSQSRESDWRVLFPTLSERDGGQIIERLAQLNVPFKFAEGGGTLQVPAARVHELRMKLAAAGLPAGGAGLSAGNGYELLDKTPFGQTQGQERMNMQRAVEGELTRTIQSLSSVHTARVHLALPQQNGFFREQQKPSASVVLSLHPGRSLERSQVAGIVHLVSSSVAELSPKAVSVIDGSGALLTGADEREGAEGLDSQQLQFRRELEGGHQRRILALLTPVVGTDNVRASVAAEVDFSQVLQTAEAWRPNQGADARPAVREQRSEFSGQPGGSGTLAGGIPGASSNQPPAQASAPINGVVQALQAAGAANAAAALGGGPGAASGVGQNTRREDATRYELDKTTTVTRNAMGSVRRLSAAVVVNHRVNTDARGKTTSTPLTDKEIEQLTALVQQGIGFNAERGDQVKVINAAFRVEPNAAPPVAAPLWQQAWALDLWRSAAAPVALAVVALLIVFALLRPAAKALLPPRAAVAPSLGSQVDEVVGGEVAPVRPITTRPPRLAGQSAEVRLEAARSMAKQNPAAVAQILRGWVNRDAA